MKIENSYFEIKIYGEVGDIYAPMPKYNFISHGGSENVEHDKSEWQEELSVQMTTLMQVVIPWSPDFLIPPKYLSLINKWNHEWNCLRFQLND